MKDGKHAPTTHPDTRLTPRTDIAPEAVKDISGALTALLADVFALYVKTKNFHWHMSGSHFRDYHLLLDEHGEQLFAMTDDISERSRKIGGTTIRSVGHIARVKRIADNDAEYVTPKDMLAELWEDNKALILSLRSAHSLCDEPGDVATASCSRTGSMKRSGAPGFSLRRHAPRTRSIGGGDERHAGACEETAASGCRRCAVS